eukprot:3577897-Pleurochrysis_carterae.AAC.1
MWTRCTESSCDEVACATRCHAHYKSYTNHAALPSFQLRRGRNELGVFSQVDSVVIESTKQRQSAPSFPLTFLLYDHNLSDGGAQKYLQLMMATKVGDVQVVELFPVMKQS